MQVLFVTNTNEAPVKTESIDCCRIRELVAECLESSYSTTEDEGVNVVSAFVGIYSLEIHNVSG